MPQTPAKGYSVLPGVVVENEMRERVERLVALVKELQPGRRVTKADVVRESIYLGLTLLQQRVESRSGVDGSSTGIERRVSHGGRPGRRHAGQKNV